MKYRKLSWMSKGRAFGYYETEDSEHSSCYYAVVDFLDANGHVIRNDLFPQFHYYGFSNDSICLGENLYTPVMPDGTPIKGLVHYGKFVLIKRDGSRLQPYCERTEDASSIEDIGENLGYLSLEENPIEFMTAMRNGFAAFGYTLDTGQEQWLFIDKYLRVHKPINGWDAYEDILPFRQGLAAIKHDGKWGYVNNKFDIIIPLKYDSCESAREGLLKVYLRKKTTHITVESYITRKDSIVWQRVKNENDTINNFYSEKDKMKYGTWIYKNEDTKWTKHTIIFIIVVSGLLLVVSRRYKRKK